MAQTKREPLIYYLLKYAPNVGDQLTLTAGEVIALGSSAFGEWAIAAKEQLKLTLAETIIPDAIAAYGYESEAEVDALHRMVGITFRRNELRSPKPDSCAPQAPRPAR